MVIYLDKVRLNYYYYWHYSFIKDFQMILCTMLGKKMKYVGGRRFRVTLIAGSAERKNRWSIDKTNFAGKLQGTINKENERNE